MQKSTQKSKQQPVLGHYDESKKVKRKHDSEKQMTKLCIYQEQEIDVKAHYRKLKIIHES